jgi:nifR3 family TIM-barrel protein
LLKIGSVELESNVIVGPMAGISNRVFRKILRKYSDGLICSEMISDSGINYSNKRTLDMCVLGSDEKNIALQLFGSDVTSMVKAAQYLDRHSNCAIIDINMGCPVKKVIKGNAGSALLKNPPLVFDIVSNIVKNVTKPVMVKIRLGFDSNSINYLEIGSMIEKAGACAIVLHARTRAQMYEGHADWQSIKMLKEHLKIPVIGNGDIKSIEDAITMKELTNCDGIMIARGLLGNPWLIKEIETYFNTGVIIEKPNYQERINQAIEHLDLLVAEYGEKIGVIQMRSHGPWYLKGLKNSHIVRQQLNQVNSSISMKNIFEEYLNNYEDNNSDD